MRMKSESDQGRKFCRGFTLIELLVVIAVIALLIGILLPALGKARDSARTLKCSTSQRQVIMALLAYANDYKQQFPPRLVGALDVETKRSGIYWYDEGRIGKYLPQSDRSNIDINSGAKENRTVGGGVLACPNHPNAGRSYAMNYWSASAATFLNGPDGAPAKCYRPGQDPGAYKYEALRGIGFDTSVNYSSKMILLGEAWAPYGSMLDAGKADTMQTWWAGADIGHEAQYSGGKYRVASRFGGGGLPTSSVLYNAGSPEMFEAKSSSDFKSYIPWYRHPRRFKETLVVKGAVPFGFVDGHVATWQASQLFDGSTTPVKSTLELLWSPKDYELEATP